MRLQGSVVSVPPHRAMPHSWSSMLCGCSGATVPFSPEQMVAVHLWLSGQTVQTSLSLTGTHTFSFIYTLHAALPFPFKTPLFQPLDATHGDYDRVRRECATKSQITQLPVAWPISICATVDKLVSWIWISAPLSAKLKP